MASPDSLRAAIEDLHQALADHKDPECKQLIGNALTTLLKVQARDYQHQQTTSGPRSLALGAAGGTA